MITWDPSPVAFVIPFLNHPVAWYGILFAFGFFAGYLMMIALLYKTLQSGWQQSSEALKKAAFLLSDRIVWYMVIGTIVGARLGFVLFYELPHYIERPSEILKVWHGGLASHGAAIGIILALFLYARRSQKEFSQLTFLTILDLVAIPTAFAGFCIRMGNFVNQEVLGYPSQVPWAIIFAHPYEGVAPVPRHPVQLYEAFAYLIIFFFLLAVWAIRKHKLVKGTLFGLFVTLVFSTRFCLEFYKLPSSLVIDESVLNAGQLLSLPFILGGLVLLLSGLWRRQKVVESRE